ncbi:MAG: hypothetical protein EBZ77_01785 [Chitinophagia bacterium]|nr:hypothetical protein [Chitinophagia bacterium]
MAIFVGMIWRVISWIIVGIIVYRLLARYIFPAFFWSSNANERLRDMQQQMQEMNRKLNQQQRAPKKKDGDFIDYEELK